MSKKAWIVYLVRCSDNSLYCGVSNDLKNRLKDHNSGKGARYTGSRRPVELVCIGPEMTKSEALKVEYRIKQLPAGKKIAALTGKEKKMTISKKDLQALNKQVKALGNKIDKLLASAGKSHKTKAKPARLKTTKKAPVKKTTTQKRPVKLTATDQVLKIIKRSKKGVNVAALIKKTGFNEKKVSNILNRIYKQGRVKRAGRGIYINA
jgi:putative endonuclease